MTYPHCSRPWSSSSVVSNGCPTHVSADPLAHLRGILTSLASFLGKALSHGSNLHGKGFNFPWTVVMCLKRSCFRVNSLLHALHQRDSRVTGWRLRGERFARQRFGFPLTSPPWERLGLAGPPCEGSGFSLTSSPWGANSVEGSDDEKASGNCVTMAGA